MIRCRHRRLRKGLQRGGRPEAGLAIIPRRRREPARRISLARIDGRANDEIRPTVITLGAQPYAEGSAMIQAGNTRVLCAASVEDGVPGFLRGQKRGWVTAEYGMLPRSTLTRRQREVGRRDGRSVEIQRLIGRSAPGRGRHGGARRAHRHHRLRRDSGRRRYPHRGDHRRLRRAAPGGERDWWRRARFRRCR